MMIDRSVLRTCRAGLMWIQGQRELHRQPADPAIDRAITSLDEALSMSACGPEDEAAQQNWLTTEQAAERFACTTRHVRRIAPKLGGRKDGRDWLIPEGAL
jgi:hypothetical protein